MKMYLTVYIELKVNGITKEEIIDLVERLLFHIALEQYECTAYKLYLYTSAYAICYSFAVSLFVKNFYDKNRITIEEAIDNNYFNGNLNECFFSTNMMHHNKYY